MAKDVMTELAEAIARLDGIDMRELADKVNSLQAAQTTPKRRSRRRRSVGHASTVQATMKRAKAADAAAGRSTRQYRGRKYTYGQAPTIEPFDPSATIQARENALESAIPGIMRHADICHVGKDANDNYVAVGDFGGRPQGTNMRAGTPNDWVNQPWTWVRIDKGAKIGKMTPDQVKAALASCGYGFSGKSKAWACDSKGNPPRRSPNYNAKGVGADALDHDD